MAFRVPYTENTQVVSSSNHLPFDSTNSEYVLRDNTTYRFDGHPILSYPIRLGNVSPMIGGHAAQDGPIYDGGGDMILGTDKGMYFDRCYFHAPGGTIFNVSGGVDTEILITQCAFSDAAGIADIADLGTIDGFRVPTFSYCNFENFDAGLLFDGTSSSPAKILLDTCPFRSVSVSGVTVLEFSGSTAAERIDMFGCYFKQVQSDTEIVRVNSGATPDVIFSYINNTQDSSVVESNILNGEAAVSAVGYRVRNSQPLRNSAVIGEVILDSPTETTITNQNEWTQVEGSVTLGDESERVSLTGTNGQAQYHGRNRINAQINISASVLGGNGTEFSMAIGKNGTIQAASMSDFIAEGSQSPVTVVTSGIEDLVQGDTLSLYIRNNDGTGNATFRNYNFNFIGV